MLDADEISELAKLRNVKPWQEEKRYVLCLLLYALSEEKIILNGGTYLWLFHGLNRYSEDLDFLEEGKLKDDLTEKVSKKLGLFGVESKIKIIKNDEYTFSFRTEIKGPLYAVKKNLCYTYVEISKRERHLLLPLTVKLDEPRYVIPITQVKGMNLQEVAAEKVRGVIARNVSRDVYDLWFLIKKLGIKVNQEHVEKKLSFYGFSFSYDLLKLKVDEHRKSWERELKPIIFGPLPAYDDVINQILEAF